MGVRVRVSPIAPNFALLVITAAYDIGNVEERVRFPHKAPSKKVMIQPYCDRCKKEMFTSGALVFSPPFTANEVRKWHLCRTCYGELLTWLRDYPKVVDMSFKN